MREKLASLRVVGPMIALIMLVTGCIYLGITTPTEAASLGAFGAMVIAMIRRRLSWSELWRALFSASRTPCMIILIINRSEEHKSGPQANMRKPYDDSCMEQ